jgi:hypothetical protein
MNHQKRVILVKKLLFSFLLLSSLSWAQDFVAVSSPSSTSVTSPMHVVAVAGTQQYVPYMQVYIDGIKVAQTSLPYVDTILTPTSGSHRFTVQFRRADGVTIKTTKYITVTMPQIAIKGPGSMSLDVGKSISLTYTASGGTAPYTWSATGLPPGLTMSSTGVLSGTPTIAGNWNITFNVTDSTGATAAMTIK